MNIQESADEAEAIMLEWLLQFAPAQELKVADIKAIANFARHRVCQALYVVERNKEP